MSDGRWAYKRYQQLFEDHMATNAQLKQWATYAGIFLAGALVGAWLG